MSEKKISLHLSKRTQAVYDKLESQLESQHDGDYDYQNQLHLTLGELKLYVGSMPSAVMSHHFEGHVLKELPSYRGNRVGLEVEW